MKRIALPLVTLLLALPLMNCSTAAKNPETVSDSVYSKQKVVYHVNYDNPKQQAGALRNIQNHINAVGEENLEVRVVLHGNGLSMLTYPDSLKKTKLKKANSTEQMQVRVDTLKNQGVAFNVCANTLKGKNIDAEEDLYNVESSDIVPSGVAHLSHLQAQGYSYIKP